MQLDSRLKKWTWIIGGAIVIAFLLLITFIPTTEFLRPAQGLLVSGKASYGLPVRLTIPVIGVDAVIEYVGVTPEGAMDAPKGPQNVAWFKLGPHPGEIGSAVMAGHYGWKDNTPAVFDELSKLRKGDTISVEDERGVLSTFVVRDSRLLGENEDASSVFTSSDGKAHLNLITCEGVWNAATKSYDKRLVVFADKQ
jgi:LPXTG-site transpeptidase (sortase) family protein